MRSYADTSLTSITVQPANPNDNEQSTRDTIALMRSYVQAAAYQQPVVDATRAALSRIPASAPAWRKCQAIYEYICRQIRFKTDEQALVDMGRSPDQELLIPPYLLLACRAGDCDDFAQLTCAMLECAGIRSMFVTLAADPEEPWRWSHVYALAILEDGSHLPMDTAARAQGRGRGFGWQAPRAFRRQEWSVS